MSTHEVFISSALADESYRRQLETHLSALKEQGLISLWHDGQIQPGTDTAKTVDVYLAKARIILLLISADFLASESCSHQMKQALKRHQAGTARVIPIVVRPCDWKRLPIGKLQALPVDGNPISEWASVDKAWTQVVVDLRQMIEDVSQSSASAPSTILPPIWNIPYPRNPVFTGREEILKRIQTQLQVGEATALSQAQAISGLGGIGKTQVAVEYAYQHRDEYQAVFWVLSDTRESLASGYIALAKLLDLLKKDAQDQQIIIEAVKMWLQTHRSWLLILDNADELAIVREFVPPVFGGHILLTTRAQSMGQLAKRIEVETMSQDVGALFLLRRVGLVAENASLDTAPSDDTTTAREICEELGGLPLALDQAGAYIEETACGLKDYQHLYHVRRSDLLKKRGGLIEDHREGVSTTWSLSFKRVEEKNPAAADLLCFCAFVHPDAIPEEMITEGVSYLGPRLQEVVSDPLLLNEAIAALLAYSLVRRNEETKTLSIHRLVQAVLKDAMDTETRRVWAQRTVRAINVVFPETEFAIWQQAERYFPHALVCVEMREQEPLPPLDLATLLFRVGWYLRERARYSEAEVFLEDALSIREHHLEPEHLDIAQNCNNLAILYCMQGKYGKAEPLYQRALQIWERQSGPERYRMAHALGNLAGLYALQGKCEKAEAFYECALPILEEQLGPEHDGVLAMLGDLASLYHKQGKHEKAELLYQRVLAVWEQRNWEPEHFFMAWVLADLGDLYNERGKYREAEQSYQHALLIFKRQWGSDHPNTAFCFHKLGGFFSERGRYTEAELLLQRALTIRQQALGLSHPDTQGTQQRHVMLLRAMGRNEEANSNEGSKEGQV